MRIRIALQCSECKRKNYTETKNKKKSVDKFEIKKYCPHCRKHTIHKEVKL